MHAKVIGNSLVVFPYGHKELQEENPSTIFNGGSIEENFLYTEEWQRGCRLVFVAEAARPAYDKRTHHLVRELTPTLSGDRWEIGWIIAEKSAQEVADYDNSLSDSVRENRNARLAECDWTQLEDAPVNKTEWATYRQALRDVPEQAGFPWNVIWPAEPA